jgi:hypothetical protein
VIAPLDALNAPKVATTMFAHHITATQLHPAAYVKVSAHVSILENQERYDSGQLPHKPVTANDQPQRCFSGAHRR